MVSRSCFFLKRRLYGGLPCAVCDRSGLRSFHFGSVGAVTTKVRTPAEDVKRFVFRTVSAVANHENDATDMPALRRAACLAWEFTGVQKPSSTPSAGRRLQPPRDQLDSARARSLQHAARLVLRQR